MNHRTLSLIILAFVVITLESCDKEKPQTYNNLPNLPSLITPPEFFVSKNGEADLSWSCTDLDGDSLIYSILFRDVNPPDCMVVHNQMSKAYHVSNLKTDKTYYWQIIATDAHGSPTVGPVWSFQTGKVSFADDLLPYFSTACASAGCHDAGGFTPVLTPALAYDELMDGGFVNIQNPVVSPLYVSVTSGSMKNYCTPEKAKLILLWIQQGATNNK